MTDQQDQPSGQPEPAPAPRGVRTNQMLDDEAKKGGQGSPKNDPSASNDDKSPSEAESATHGNRGHGAPER